MKLHELFKKKNKNRSTTELDQRLDIVLDLEKRRADLRAKTAEIDDGLAKSYATDQNPSEVCAKLANHRVEIEALTRIINKARIEAVEALRSESQGSRERIEGLEAKIKKIQRELSLSKIQEISKFIHIQGLNITWPSEYQGGHIGIPVLPGIEAGEILELVEARAPQDISVDNPFASELEKLRKNLRHEQALCFMPLEESLNIMLTERKRTLGVP